MAAVQLTHARASHLRNDEPIRRAAEAHRLLRRVESGSLEEGETTEALLNDAESLAEAAETAAARTFDQGPHSLTPMEFFAWLFRPFRPLESEYLDDD